MTLNPDQRRHVWTGLYDLRMAAVAAGKKALALRYRAMLDNLDSPEWADEVEALLHDSPIG